MTWLAAYPTITVAPASFKLLEGIDGPLPVRSLVLMVITLLTNVAARALVRRVSGTALPVGRGI